MSSVPDLDFSIYTLRIYSRLQPLSSISATLLYPYNGIYPAMLINPYGVVYNT
jgi:hypothetical protein